MQTFLKFALVALLVGSAGRIGRAQTVNDAQLVVQPVVSGADSVTAMLFLGPDDLLLGEKNTGRVWRATQGVLSGPLLDLDASGDSEMGLLCMTKHPAFAQNGWIYMYYSHEDAAHAWTDNRVVRFTWDGSQLVGPETMIISFPRDPNQSNGANHDGGIIAFGPDGKLYGVTGDLNRRRIEQNMDAAGAAGVGGIFRVNDDGTVPADNPFSSHALPEIRRLYAYGVRNSFGLTFDAETGRLWDTENGPGSYDEVNLVPRGFNSGWVRIMGPVGRDAEGTSDLVVLPNSQYSDPELSWLTPVAVTAISFLHSAKLPCSLQGAALIGDCNTGHLSKLTLNETRDAFVLTGGLGDLVADNSTERDSIVLGTGWNCPTHIEIGPDGYIYVSTLGGSSDVWRIRPRFPQGDLNCDGAVDNSDIDAFVLAITDAPAYAAQFPACNIQRGDCNCDAAVDNSDIDAFVALLLGQF